MDSSESSAAASSTSEPFAFVGDTGPGFDPAGAGERAEQLRGEEEAEARAGGLDAFEIPPVDETSIRDFLRNAGDMAHSLVGVGESDWRATQSDLDRIAPPATRIINRYEPTRAIAQKSDEAAVIIGLGMYSWRSMLERQAVVHARKSPGARTRPIDVPAPDPGEPPSAPESAPTTSPDANARMDVVPGYTTAAERLQAARERTPNGQPRQDS